MDPRQVLQRDKKYSTTYSEENKINNLNGLLTYYSKNSSNNFNQPKMNSKNNLQNGQASFTLNPQASPFQSSHLPVGYPPTANYFNLTSISKNKSEYTRPQTSRLNSETRSTSSEQSSSNYSNHKKHKKERTKLDELKAFHMSTQEDVRYYEKKRKKLIEELKEINAELKSCEQSLENHRSKLSSIQIDIEREKNRIDIEREKNRIESNKQQQVLQQQKQALQQLQTVHQQQQSQNSNQLSPSTCSINNLTLNATSKPNNVQSTINNVVNNLLNKKKEIEFHKYDYIFKVLDEVLEAKSVDANSLGTKVDLVINIKKLVGKEEAEKQGLRYIVRGCIYDPTSLYQLDNLSFVKSYDFQVTDRKKHSWDNSESSACKQVYPFDVTNYTRLVDFKEKKLTIICHLNQKLIKDKRIALGVYLVKRLDFNGTLELVRKNDIVRKKKSEITKNQVTNAFDQSCGIQMDSIKISLIDPLSKSKISWPCIGEACEHIATFDGLTFIESNSKKFSWFCPICGKTIGYDQLFYDELIKEILKKVSMDCTAIAFDKLSNWMPLSEETSKKETVEADEDCITLE